MQPELPLTPAAASVGGSTDAPPEKSKSVLDAANRDDKTARDAVSENAVVVFARKGCCMCHVIKLLLRCHGVDPTIHNVDEKNEADVAEELSTVLGIKATAAPPQLPAVFVGGQLFGGLDEVMGAHITGELMPKLRAAGALWL